MKGIEKRYRKALAEIPAPGTGCHPYLLRVANYAVMATLRHGGAGGDPCLDSAGRPDR